jgi:outer membrane receptor protein involved in Fe transport
VAPGLGDRTARDVTTRAFGGSVESERGFRLLGRESRLRAGAELARERLDTTYRGVDEEGASGARLASGAGRRDRVALFAAQDLRLSERLRVSGGVRWDRISDEFRGAASAVHEAWSPRLGVNLRLFGAEKPLSVFVQASRAFKAPTLDQLFDPHPFSDFSGGTFTISNPDLLPQKAQNLEAGISRRADRSRFELVLYRMTVDDEIDFDPASFRYRNIGRSLHRGVEAAGSIGIGPITPSVSYSWSRVEAREGEDRGRQLKNVPEHLLRVSVASLLPGGVSAEAVWTRLSKRYLDDANRFPLDDASVLDVRVTRAFGRFRARLDLANLTDSRYAQYGFALSDFSGGSVPYYYPASGFSARVGIDFRK